MSGSWTIQKLSENTVRTGPALVLLKKDGSRISYSWQCYEWQVGQTMSSLKRIGVSENDFVVVAAPNLPESFFVLLGVIAVGAIPVPINIPILKEPGQGEFLSIIKDCRPKLILADSCLSKYLSSVEHATFGKLLFHGRIPPSLEFDKNKSNPEALLIMPYTSGTTGKSKGVMLSEENILDRVSAVTQELDADSQERILSYLSLGHISELIATFFGQLYGGFCVYFTEYAKDVVENREKFRAAFPTILQAARPTIFLAVPKVWANIRKQIEHKTRYIPVDLGKQGLIRNYLVSKIKNRLGFDETRRFISAGSKILQEDVNFFAKLGIHVDDIYGQTETAGPLTLNGKAIGNVSVTSGEDDEILVSGPNVMTGYYNNPEVTKRILVDGVYRTGDIGIWTTDKVLYGGRLRDGFKNAQGEFVSATKIEEMEDKIRKIPGVDEVIICGDGKPYPVALVFSATPSENLRSRLQKTLPKIENSLFRIGNFILADISTLETTATLKVKRNAMIKKFEKEIAKL
ncbi:MAG: hypothetical protein A2918_02200 [Candidatus Yanofskybacteria bacterium RIFCSPLOWO2_01_FULL_42_49]|uniref:AMP-dependent synthetase/ligase domain-containing protein n=1 Tax=Candidatus Yanofskybacteria bacterium RIFCSPLOWO2_01_FULL_42_49 TaxID=1802694 RepID=A0A1F8GB89_9BACT|nr:MAG: hypothetical protein A2918_02200 [Candidatus Yanofskybacteria bacterium RIFCSPLOWO2_01_FULL_42_49]